MKLWQRNAIASVVVLVALAAVWFGWLRSGWSDYRAAEVPAHTVAKGAAATIDGVTWRIAGVRHLDYAGPTRLPAGTVLHVYTVERDGAGAGPPCTAMLTDGTRRWQAEQLGAYTVAAPAGVGTDCRTGGPVQFGFLLPGDVVPTALDVVTSGRITVRLLR